VGIGLIAANAVIRLGYGITALLAPSKPILGRIPLAPDTEEFPEARLFVRGFAAHQIAVAVVGLASLPKASLRRPAMLWQRQSTPTSAPPLSTPVRGRLDLDLTGGIAFRCGLRQPWSRSQRRKCYHANRRFGRKRTTCLARHRAGSLTRTAPTRTILTGFAAVEWRKELGWRTAAVGAGDRQRVWSFYLDLVRLGVILLDSGQDVHSLKDGLPPERGPGQGDTDGGSRPQLLRVGTGLSGNLLE
jgi:hypothetical protein